VSGVRGQKTEDRGQGSKSVVRMQILSINKTITKTTCFYSLKAVQLGKVVFRRRRIEFSHFLLGSEKKIIQKIL
jgi:hypothetical protein